ncbi:MAG TPA: UDP-N-acetylmuramate dehydrogenase [Polyangiaceae bacterium]
MSVRNLIRENVPLAALTTLGVGGPARFFLDAADEETAHQGLAWASSQGLSTAVIGGGSNVLVSDRGFDGLVLRVRIGGVKEVAGSSSEAPGHVWLEIGAGEELDPLVERCARAGYGGIECLSGIPGYVGATPIQNVGAYGQEIGERIVSVRTMHRATYGTEVFDNAACRFTYRSSIFKHEWKGSYVVLGITLSLLRDGVPVLRYPELARELAARGTDPLSLLAVREGVLAIRRSKSMVIEAGDPNRNSAGSFFVNPLVTERMADAIEEKAQREGETRRMPRFAAESGVKLSAAWLIEHTGFAKGTSDGPVGISTRHALAIVNRGGATAAQIFDFARKVRDAVHSRFGVSLVHEPVLVGFSADEERALT